MLKRFATIRKDTIKECPYGLSILSGCMYAGDSVDQMETLDTVSEPKQPKLRKSNRRVYRHNKSGERCVYADKVIVKKNAVHCDYGDGGERLRDFPMRPNPNYPRVFQGLGSSYLYSYPFNSWHDRGQNEMFSGIYSVYASTGEIFIQKDSIRPDPILIELLENIAIKEK